MEHAAEQAWRSAQHIYTRFKAERGDEQEEMNSKRTYLTLCVPDKTADSALDDVYLFEGCEGLAALTACSAGYEDTPEDNTWFACSMDPRIHAKWDSSKNKDPRNSYPLDLIENAPLGSFVHFAQKNQSGGHVLVMGPQDGHTSGPQRIQASAYGLGPAAKLVTDPEGDHFQMPSNIFDTIVSTPRPCHSTMQVQVGLTDVYPASITRYQKHVAVPWINHDLTKKDLYIDYPHKPYRFVQAQWIGENDTKWICKRVPYTPDYVTALEPPLPCDISDHACQGQAS